MPTDLVLAPRDPEAAPTLYNAAADGNEFVNKNGRVLLVVANTHSTDTLIVTINERRTCGAAHHFEEQGLIHKTLSVPSGGVGLFGPFERKAFNEHGTEKVLVTYSFVEEAASPVVGVAALVDSESSG